MWKTPVRSATSTLVLIAPDLVESTTWVAVTAAGSMSRRIESPGLPSVERVLNDVPSVMTTVISW